MIFYYRMPKEMPQQSKSEVKIVSPDEFAELTPSPEKLQELVYSLYTHDGIPRTVVPQVSSPLSRLYHQSDKKIAYITATGEAESFFQAATSENLKTIEAELRNYKNLRGFLKVEWGEHKPNENLPIEAMVFTKGFPWPDGMVGYAASFTTNPLLPRQIRLDIQKDMHEALYALAEKEGFSHNIFTILAPHVVSFVEASGLTAVKSSGQYELNRGDAYTDSIINSFPRYWDVNPGIYRFVPNTNHDN